MCVGIFLTGNYHCIMESAVAINTTSLMDQPQTKKLNNLEIQLSDSNQESDIMTATKLITIVICTIVSLSSINTAPIVLQSLPNQPTFNEDRPRRQTDLSDSRQIAQIQSTDKCPLYVDGRCDKVQDVVCARDQIKLLLNETITELLQRNTEQASEQGVGLCQSFEPSTNSIRNLHHDFETLASLFEKVAQDQTDSRMSQLQCQLRHIKSFLGETVDQFCEQNCSAAIGVSCDDNFERNEEIQYVQEEFNIGCMFNLLNSLYSVLDIINNDLTSNEREGACSPTKCFRATEEEEDKIKVFIESELHKEQQSLASPNIWFNGTECRPSGVFEMSVSDLINLVTATANEMATLPSLTSIVNSLNSTVLPLLHEKVVPIVGLDAELDGVIPSASLIQDENLSLTSCLVTRLGITFEALLHNKLRHQWTLINRNMDIGCI